MQAATYAEIQRVLTDQRSLADAAEAHGTLAGCLCAAVGYRFEDWLQEILPEGRADGLSTAALRALYVDTAGSLEGSEMEFELLLPEEALHAPPELVAFASLGLAHRLAYALVTLAWMAPVLIVFGNLRALFGLYARGVVFARGNAAHLKWIGVGLVAYGLAPGLGHLFLTVTQFEIDHAWFHVSSLQAPVLGGLMMVIAQVMEVGRELEEDRSQYV